MYNIDSDGKLWKQAKNKEGRDEFLGSVVRQSSGGREGAMWYQFWRVSVLAEDMRPTVSLSWELLAIRPVWLDPCEGHMKYERRPGPKATQSVVGQGQGLGDY